MNKKESGRWLKKIVLYCIGITSLMILGAYVAAWFGIDTEVPLKYTCAVFGGELLISAMIKLTEIRRKPDATANILGKTQGGTKNG